ncbi:MAG TPA: beta family protein [Longimicrobium sp.]|jgi:hypothetical protein|uniref:beta family protein n=1 Tax=Longimicrobium sp. TaxID=2029185 RepID=UPI002ED78AD9
MQPSFGPGHYVPLLKGKSGEYQALGGLALHDQHGLTPFIDVPPIAELDGRVLTPAQHYQAQFDKLEKYWGKRGPVFVDSRLVQPGRLTAGGEHGASVLFDLAERAGFGVVPVTGLRREDTYQQAVRNAVGRLGTGVCLRMEDADLTDQLAARMDALLEWLGVPVRDADLVLDYRGVPEELARSLATGASVAIRELPHLDRWRTFTLASGGFPRSLGELGRGSEFRIQRSDWNLWQAVSRSLPAAVRRPAFGDYGIAHPDLEDADPRLMNVPVALRYTTATEFLVLKRGTFRKGGGAAFQKLCQELVQLPDYSGNAFSRGDEYIARTARAETKGGNPEAWRQAGTSHHLTLAAIQVRDHADGATPGVP